MTVNKIDHISIAVENLDEARRIWEPMLGKEGPDETYTEAPEKIRVARYYVGEVGVELMESTSSDGQVADFIEKHGQGIMLISMNVDSARKSRQQLETLEYPFVGDVKPFRDGEYTFIHPKKMNGVLVELIDSQSKITEP